MKKNYMMAKFLTENIEKENIISEVFKLFSVDCITRCQFEPTVLDNLIKEFNENDECDTSILEEIITFIKGEQKNAKNRENELFLNIKDYIDRTYMQDINIEQIAADLHISYYYMCHIFKDKFNISINSYRTKKRLENAMMLLLKSDDKISDIAFRAAITT